jgi:hypothetical protein
MRGERCERVTFAQLIAEGALEIGDGYRAKNDELGGVGLIFLRAGHVTDSHIDFEAVERSWKIPPVLSRLEGPYRRAGTLRLTQGRRLEPGGALWVRRGPLSQRSQRQPGKVTEVIRQTIGSATKNA